MSSILRVLHTADWHLRDSQYTSLSRGDDFTKAAMAVIDVAIAEDVDAICNSGDILNNKRPSARNIKDLVAIDQRLRDAGIPMYVISGNHDFSRPSWISILDEETKDGDNQKTVGIINADNRLINIPGTECKLFGVPAMGATAFRSMVDTWPSADVLMSHELLQEFCAFKPDPDSLTLADYPTDKYRMILLGDIHTSNYRSVPPIGNGSPCLIGYPGSIELCSKSEPVDKSVSLLTYQDDECIDIERFKVPSRKALFYRVITEDQADQALADMKQYVQDDPIVLVRYDRRMHAVPKMFMTVLAGSRAILRCAAFADVAGGRLLGVGGEDNPLDHLKTLREFVSDFIPTGNALHDLAIALADADVDHKQLISDYVNERIGENESDTF